MLQGFLKESLQSSKRRELDDNLLAFILRYL